MTTDEEWELWVKEQLDSGMVNFHFTVNPSAKDITVEKIKRAILDSEKAIKEGKFKIIEVKD